MTNVIEIVLLSMAIGFGFAAGVFSFWSMAYVIAKVIV
jgi:hypothetical protein